MNVLKCLKGCRAGQSQALLSVAERQEQRQCPQTEAQEAPSEHLKSLVHSEGDGALAQVAQRGCRVSTPPAFWRCLEVL